MGVSMKAALRQLCVAVVREQDEQVDQARLVGEARRQFLARCRSASQAAPKRFPLWLQHAAFSGIGGLAAVGVLVLWSMLRQPLTFTAGEALRPGPVGQTLVAQAQQPLPLKFSDGTSLVVDPGGAARVVSLRRNGADVLVDRGVVHASVVPRGDTSWVLLMGPYEVRVTGTQFDTGWDPSTQKFFLQVREGAVVVSGCSLAARAVDAGSEVTASCPSSANAAAKGPAAEASSRPAESSPSSSASIEANPPAARPSGLAASGPAIPGEEGSLSEPVAQPSSPGADGGVGAGEPPWVPLARERQYARAMQVVGDQFEAECQRVSAQDLLLLADSARFAGQGARATQALQTLRARFPSSPLAGVAAFHLGRMAQDGGRNAEAIAWLQTALREQPAGPLAREALGRLLEAYQGAGQGAQAKEAAKQYLSRYPKGPHAALAQSIVEK
ncbi:MAG: tetratricopeptide repeat protein [Deltaproteobacteria bacterium]|nr:tetratricopeptide repeat protein [Deltaproteobacteria bacterium]